MVKNLRQWVIDICVIISALGALEYLLERRGLSIWNLNISSASSHWLGLTLAVAVLALIVGLTVYRVYLASLRPDQLSRELEELKRSHAQKLADAKKRVADDLNSEISRAYQIRDIALKEARDSKDEQARLRLKLEQAKKCFYCPPDALPIVVEPTYGPNPMQYLIVTNKGTEQSFWAQCTLFNDSGTKKTTFKFGWDPSGYHLKKLVPEESGRLRVARVWDEKYLRLNHIALCEDGRGEPPYYDIEARQWDKYDLEPGLEYRIEVKIFGESGGVHSEEFIVKPASRQQ